MIQKFIKQKGNSKLILFFVGWGFDDRPFRHLPGPDEDCMICYDYHTLDFDTSSIKEYQSVILIAWSLGVWAASQVIPKHPELHIKKTIAINGTPYGFDKDYGFHPGMCDRRFRQFNEMSLHTFYRHICGDTSAYKAFREILPQRSLEDIQSELTAIRELNQKTTPDMTMKWSAVVIGQSDMIILARVQRRGWKNCHNIRQVLDIDVPHLLKCTPLKKLIKNIVNG